MSWIRSAMHKAAEVPGGARFRAAVRTYTDSVVQHAGHSVSEAAKMFQDRTATQNMKSFSDAAKRLEEDSVSFKGEERVQLLRRWLVALREFERLNASSVENDGSSEDPCTSNEQNVTTEKPTMILYNDPDLGGSPMNFRDVFVQSQALEGMTMSMILGTPNEEEIWLLHEIFGLCLTGGREVHDAIVKSIQDMAEAFSVYDAEMLVRRQELLQFAQTAITGLKVTADVARIDSEISEIQQRLNRMKYQKSAGESGENSSEAKSDALSKDTKESVAHIQSCCRLKSLLLKKILLKRGDTSETHAQKVDKLKVLLKSLHNSASKTEKRIVEHREQRKEALSFRVTRTSDVSQIEKDLEAEIIVLEKQKDKLEDELRKVDSTLAAAYTRLQNAREERLQFDEDHDEFLLHLQEKEDELSKTIVSYRAEADTCKAFINFLEATWALQSSYMEQRDKQVNDQLQNHEAYIVNVATSFLSTYKDQLEPAIVNVRKLRESLKGYEKIIDPDEEFLQDIKRRENLEQEYLDAEAKVIDIFDAVESIKQHFYSTIDDASREGVVVFKELCDAIEKLNSYFKIIKRPNLRIENPTEEFVTPGTGSPQGTVSSPVRLPDFKSIFTQKLLIKSPRHKPYIPLGGASENSPVSTMENDTKSAEREQHAMKVRESEKPAHPYKDVSNLFLEFEDESIGYKPTAKSDQGQLDKMSSGLDEKSWGELMASENQESKMHQHSTLNPDKELAKPALVTETGMNTETAESGHGKTSGPSRVNSEQFLDSNDGIPEVTLAAKAFSQINDTTESVHGKTSQLSTGNGKSSVDPDEQLPKSTSKGEVSTEVGGWEFEELLNELKDDDSSSCRTPKLTLDKSCSGEGAGFDSI